MQNGLQINKKAFLSSALILFVFMIIAGSLTYIIVPGSYKRQIEGTREVLLPDSFEWHKSKPCPVWRWFTAPLEVLWGKDAKIIIGIIVFILFVGASFSLLLEAQVLEISIALLCQKFYRQRYILVAILTFCCMSMGALLGVYEEILPLVPIVIAIACSMKWDVLMGLGMSLLACCFGFTAALVNPFSIGVAQSLAGLPLFSGSGNRLILLFLLYVLLVIFLIRYAKKIESNPKSSPMFNPESSSLPPSAQPRPD